MVDRCNVKKLQVLFRAGGVDKGWKWNDLLQWESVSSGRNVSKRADINVRWLSKVPEAAVMKCLNCAVCYDLECNPRKTWKVNWVSAWWVWGTSIEQKKSAEIAVGMFAVRLMDLLGRIALFSFSWFFKRCFLYYLQYCWNVGPALQQRRGSCLI